MELNEYFVTNWSKLWLPHKGVANQIRIDREPYMKYTVTDLEAPNQPLVFARGRLKTTASIVSLETSQLR